MQFIVINCGNPGLRNFSKQGLILFLLNYIYLHLQRTALPFVSYKACAISINKNKMEYSETKLDSGLGYEYLIYILSKWNDYGCEISWLFVMI